MSLAVAGTPTNLHLSEGAQARLVESDLYDIASRIQELSPRLHIFELEDDTEHCFAIQEMCDDGVSRLVYRVKELDDRVIEKLRYMMSKPLSERYEELERQEHQLQEEIAEEQFEELYERLGGPMWTQLERDGFADRPKSYPKKHKAMKGIVGS